MLGKILGGLLGAKAAKNRRGVSEPGGALMGVASVALARRFGIPGILAAAAGGYALKKYGDRRKPVASKSGKVVSRA
jgi:hypothetical protein